MAMIPGTVSVSDSGTETYTPNDATNAAKILYLLLLDNQQSNKTPQTTITPPTVTIDPVTFVPTVVTPASVNTVEVAVEVGPDAKKAQAKLANTMASWMVLYIQANAEISGQIDDNGNIINGAIL